MGIEPTTSGTDLPLLCRLSYEVGQRKSGTNMVINRGEEKWWNRELTLKCKLKCYVKPMKDPLGVSPSKGKQGTTRGKEKIF